MRLDGGMPLSDRFSEPATAASFTVRPPWQAAPLQLRRAVECRIGSPIVASYDAHGGMTPGPAAALLLGNGARVFVKAINRTVSAGSYRLYQQEATVLNEIPLEAPAAAPLGVVEVGDWIALVTAVAPGRVAGPPWTPATIEAVARACTTTATIIAPATIPAVLDRLPDLDGWSALAADPRHLTTWERLHIEQLAQATTGWRHWTRGQHLTHQDIRCDNALVDPANGEAVLVDWGYGSAGAPWLDRALLAADVMAAGHADGPETARRQALSLLADQPTAASRFVIAQAGMWRRNSTLPPHPGMTTHRLWQRARATALQPLLEALIPLISS
jgi:hypothetical protein